MERGEEGCGWGWRDVGGGVGKEQWKGVDKEGVGAGVWVDAEGRMVAWLIKTRISWQCYTNGHSLSQN